MSRCAFMLIVVLLAGFLCPAAVLAHKVNIFAYVEAGTIYSESYFPDGRPVDNGKVLVFDSAEQLLLEGQTDKQGLLQFPVPKVDDLTLEIDAGMGHKNIFKLKKTAIKE
jgi:nickel transport protein